MSFLNHTRIQMVARGLLAGVLAGGLLALPAVGSAQTPAKTGGGRDKLAPVAAPASVPGPQLSQAYLSMLVHTTTIAVNQANLTNDYTVLHRLGASSFQREQTPDGLGRALTPFREGRIDLSGAVVTAPVWSAEPRIADGILHLEGHYPTQPKQVWFYYDFALEGGAWRPVGVGLSLDGPVRIPQQPGAAAGKVQ